MLLLLWFPSQQVPAGKGRRGKTHFKFCRPTTSTAVMSGFGRCWLRVKVNGAWINHLVQGVAVGIWLFKTKSCATCLGPL